MASASRARLLSYLFIATGGLIVVAAAAAWSFTSVNYEAYALLKVASVSPGVLERPRRPSPEEFSVFKRTQMQLMLSTVVAHGTLRDRSISGLSMFEAHLDDPVSWLKSQLTIDYPDDAEIMRVSMTGSDPEELIKIVNKVVDVYMREIVEHDKLQRMDNEEKLRRAHEQQTTEYEKQLQALRVLEGIHKTSGSDEAQLKRRIAVEELDQTLARRARIAEELRQIELEIGLAEGRQAAASRETRTAQLAAARPVEQPSLEELRLKKQILEAQFEEADKTVKSQTRNVAALDSFSAQVAAKQEELAALRAIKDRLGAELDRAMVERLAPDRITKVDEAVLVDQRGDRMRRNVIFGSLAALGLLLAGAGIVLRRPRT